MPQPTKRRIQPQLIPPSGASAATPNSNGSLGPAAGTALTEGASNAASADASGWKAPGLKEDSEYAASAGMKGRRIFVELDGPSKDVNWRKLLKAQGVTESQIRKQKQQAEAKAPPMPGALLGNRQSAASNPLANVIARLERQYVIPSDEESSSDEEEADAEKDEADSEGQSGEESGTEKEVNEGDYDYEDDFIDDSEFADFVGGDRRKPKHGGFFINKGEIEKGEEEVGFPDSPVKKKGRKRARAAGPSEDEHTEADGAKKARQEASASEGGTKAKRPKKKAAASGEGSDAAQGAVVLARQASQGGATSLAAQAATAGMLAGAAANGRPAANGGSSGGGGGEFTPELRRVLEDLRTAAAAHTPDASANGQGAIPKGLNPALTPVACLLAKQCEATPQLRERILDEVVCIFEEHYARGKLARRLDSLAKGVRDELAASLAKIKDYVDAKLKSTEQRPENGEPSQSDAHQAAEAFPWEKNAENHLLSFATLANKVEGKWGTAEDLQSQLPRLLELWPPGRMTAKCLQAALQRAAASPRKPPKRTQSKSLDDGEAAASQVPRRLPSIPEEGRSLEAAPSAPAESSQPRDAGATGAGAPPQSAAPANEVVDPAAEALRLGASADVIVESIKAANTAGRVIVNKALMCAGANGYTTAEILDKANVLGLTGEQPWDKSKKSYISNTIRAFKFHAAVGNLRYAHTAFPGVKEAAERELEAQEAKRQAREEALQKAAAAKPEAAPGGPQPQEAARQDAGQTAQAAGAQPIASEE